MTPSPSATKFAEAVPTKWDPVSDRYSEHRLHIFIRLDQHGEWSHATSWCWCRRKRAEVDGPPSLNGCPPTTQTKWDILECEACGGSGIAD